MTNHLLSKRELIASILPRERLGFYIGGNWETEYEILGIDKNDPYAWDKNAPRIYAERAKLVADALIKALES